MEATVQTTAGTGRRVSRLVWTQLLVLAAYTYAAAAYLVTDADHFPEQAPPAWSWPAVAAVGVGYVPALVCLLLALPSLTSAAARDAQPRWRLLAVVSAASVLMLLVMATPPGWALFDWYVG